MALHSGTWTDLHDKYSYSENIKEINKEKIRIRQPTFGGLIGQGFRFYKSDKGLIIHPMLLIRSSKISTIFIPWNDVVEVRHKKTFMADRVKIIIGNPFVGFIEMDKTDLSRFKEFIKP